VETPRLVIPEDDPTAASGKCSACKAEFCVPFVGNRNENMTQLRLLFEGHVLAEHPIATHC
jgi:hypothetical protein